MTSHALDSGVRRVLIGRELGLHHGMTRLAAKADRVHVVYSAVSQFASDNQVGEGGDGEESDHMPKGRAAEVDDNGALQVAFRLETAALRTMPIGISSRLGKTRPAVPSTARCLGMDSVFRYQR